MNELPREITGPVLETERLRLRPPAARDGAAYVGFFQSERARFVGGPLDEFKSWYAFYTEVGHWMIRGYGSFAVTRQGEDRAIGLVGPWFPHTWPEREIGWMMFEGEGEGIAFEAARATRAYAYRELGWTTAVSYIDPGNTRSIRLAERLGAVRDADAPRPDAEDLVFRHPGPEVL